MASYLKNTYVDGNLAIEGALKVGALDLGETNIPSLESTATSRLVKTKDGNPKQLTQSGLTITESSQITTLTLKAEETTAVQDNNEDQAIQAFNVAILPPSLTSQTVLSIHENTGNTVSEQHGFMTCIPQTALYLWNQAKGGDIKQDPDYQWHFQPQTVATPGA